MQWNKSIFTFLIFSSGFLACNNDSGKTKAQKRAEEQNTRNPIQKGRYLCYQLLATGDKIAPDLFILSNNIYQVADTVGRYSYNYQQNAMQIIDGPLHNPSEPLIGFYTAKGTPTSGGGHTLETMIEFRKKDAKDSADKKVVMQCNCSEF